MTFEALKPFLLTMFKIGFPTNPIFHFLDENNNKVYVNSEDDYQQLLKIGETGPIKLYITSQDIMSESSEEHSESEVVDNIDFESDKSPAEYEVLEVRQPEESPVEIKSANSCVEEEKESSPVIIKVEYCEESKETSPAMIKIEYCGEEIKESVDECIEETKEIEIYKEKVVKDEDEIIEDMIMSTAESRVYDSVKNSYDIIEGQETILREIVQETLRNEMPNIISELQMKMVVKELIDREVQYCYCCQENDQNKGKITEIQMVKEKVKKNSNFMEKLRKLGRFLKEQLLEIPEAAVDLLDDFSQMFEGDPNLFFAGKRYPKSVIIRTKHIMEIFPDSNLQYVVNYVKRMPKNLSLDEVLELYIMKELKDAEDAKIRQQQQQQTMKINLV